MPRIGYLVAMLLFAFSGHAARAAEGNELHAQGALQLSLAGAGSASPQDATWTLLNPAAIAGMERRLDIYVQYMYLQPELRPDGPFFGANPTAGKLRDYEHVLFPSGALTIPLGDFTLGLGGFGIGGSRGDFDRPRTTLGILGNADRRSEFEIAKFPIALARRFQNGWALGLSVVPALARFRTDSLTLRLLETQGNHEWDWAAGVGVQAGAHWRGERVSVAATYSSPVWMSKFRKYDEDLLMGAFDLPQKAQLGLAWRVSPRLELLLDYRWIGWERTRFTADRTIKGGLDWDNQHIVKAGAAWRVAPAWTLRAGVSWGRSPIDEEVVFLNSITPAVTQWHLGAGVSWQVSPAHAVHVAIAHAVPEDLSDSGRGGFFSAAGRGTRIRYREDTVAVQYSFMF